MVYEMGCEVVRQQQSGEEKKWKLKQHPKYLMWLETNWVSRFTGWRIRNAIKLCKIVVENKVTSEKPRENLYCKMNAQTKKLKRNRKVWAFGAQNCTSCGSPSNANKMVTRTQMQQYGEYQIERRIQIDWCNE